jgi:anti-anti-sigma regulatory factor
MYGYTTTTNLGGEFKLAAVSEKIIKILSKTKLDEVFDKYASVEEALMRWLQSIFDVSLLQKNNN